MLLWRASTRLSVSRTDAVTVLGNLHGSPVKAPQAVNQRGHNRGLADVSRVSADYDGLHLLRRATPSRPHSIEAPLHCVNAALALQHCVDANRLRFGHVRARLRLPMSFLYSFRLDATS